MQDDANDTEAELRQRAACLLNRAMSESGLTTSELARRVCGDAANSSQQKQIRRISQASLLPKLHTLSNILEACGFELVISMRRATCGETDE